MRQASTASWPVRFTSELAKHGPVYTSAVRASRYWPEICGLSAPSAAAAAHTRSTVSRIALDFISIPPERSTPIVPPRETTINSAPLRRFAARPARPAAFGRDDLAVGAQQRLRLRAPVGAFGHTGSGIFQRVVEHFFLAQALANRARLDQHVKARHGNSLLPLRRARLSPRPRARASRLRARVAPCTCSG